MPVTEALMKPGSFRIELIEELPRTIAETLDFFDHLVITPTRIDTRALNDSSKLATSMYTGIIDTFENSRRVISGLGLLAWFGDDDRKGPVRENVRVLTAASFTTAITNVFTDHAQLTLGTITTTGITGVINWQYAYMSARDVLDFICRRFDAEYRVSPAGLVDFGTRDNLFVWSPTHVVTRLAGRGDDPPTGVRGLFATDISIDESKANYASQVIVLGEGDGLSLQTGSANVVSNPYKTLNGATAGIKRVVADHGDASATAAGNLAAKFLARGNDERPDVSVAIDSYAFAARVRPGDRLMIFDPSAGFQDLAEGETRYRGHTFHPLKVRVYGYTWPVLRGYGVYARAKDNTFTDLTDYVIFEQGSATLDVSRYFNQRSRFGTPDTSARDRAI